MLGLYAHYPVGFDKAVERRRHRGLVYGEMHRRGLEIAVVAREGGNVYEYDVRACERLVPVDGDWTRTSVTFPLADIRPDDGVATTQGLSGETWKSKSSVPRE